MGKFSRYTKFILVFLTFVLSISCKGLISVDSAYNNVDGKNIFDLDETAISMVTNIYAQIAYDNRSILNSKLSSLSFYAGLLSDELTLFNSSNNISFFSIYTNELSSTNSPETWQDVYAKIFVVNSAINGITASSKLSEFVKMQLLGEAHFMRAYFYFYLVNLYGDVPLVLKTDPLINSSLPRSAEKEVYDQIIKDLKSAQTFLNENYLSGNLSGFTFERVRPTKWAASAMLARVYLYLSDYSNAEEQASLVINQNQMYSLDSLNGVFLKNSNESILQFQNVYNTNGNTGEGQTFILNSNGPNNDEFPVYLSNYILNDFENGDLRRAYWVGSVTTLTGNTYYFPYKYKSGASTEIGNSTEYLMVLRLAEQYLIRAECYAQENNLKQSIEDINIIRKRAGLKDIQYSITKDSLLKVIFHERKMELFTEWGHRWLDLKRTNNIDAVMTIVTKNKGGEWSNHKQLFPVSMQELLSDPNLVQTPGY